MATIEVTETSPNSFSVTVHGTQTTSHQVNVKPDYAQPLLDASQTVAELVSESNMKKSAMTSALACAFRKGEQIQGSARS